MSCGSLDGSGGLEENGYMYLYGWVPLLSTWNYHIVNWLYSKIKSSFKTQNLLPPTPPSCSLSGISQTYTEHSLCARYCTKNRILISFNLHNALEIDTSGDPWTTWVWTAWGPTNTQLFFFFSKVNTTELYDPQSVESEVAEWWIWGYQTG